jgi:hypothetical protein
MKHLFIAKKVLATVLVSGAILVAAPSFGKAHSHIEILKTSTQATVQFAGTTQDNAMLFDVKVDNPNGDTFTITVTTKDGDVLFVKDFNTKSFAKTFKLLKSEEVSSYNFKVTSSNKSLEQNFAVDATTKTIDNVVVTKL